jgi:hypothetical protein
MNIVVFYSEEIAQQVASHLFNVTIEEKYLTFSNYDSVAFELAVSLEKIRRIDYSFVNAIQVQFLDVGLFYSFILHVEASCIKAYPHELEPITVPFVYNYSIFTIRQNAQFIQLLKFLEPVANCWNTIIESAVLATVEKKDIFVSENNFVSEYSLTLWNGDRGKRVKFLPNGFRSVQYRDTLDDFGWNTLGRITPL